MSRHIVSVPTDAVEQHLCPLAGPLPKYVVKPETVQLAIGYDDPCAMYFMDIMPDCEQGIWYGVIGLGKQVDKDTLYEVASCLGLRNMAEAIGLDIPF